MDTVEVEEPSARKDEDPEDQGETTTKGPVIEVLTKEQEERIAEIDVFLAEHDVKVNRKKKKLLASLSVGPYETYKLGVIIANCCRVRRNTLHRR